MHISGSDEAVCFFFSGEGDVPAGRPSSDPGKVEETETWHRFSNWPLVGNEGMNPQYTNVKVDSRIPY